MIRIGITGHIGAGKTTVAKIFQSFGAKYIDADKVGHKILKEKKVIKRLVKAFGKEILNKRGQIDRKKLAAVAFKNKKNQKKLNALTHPIITKEITNQSRGRGLAVIEAALLFESELKEKIDFTILVTAPQKMKWQRVKDNYPDMKRRIACQTPERELRKKVNFVIANRGSLTDLKKACQKLWEIIKAKFQPIESSSSG